MHALDSLLYARVTKLGGYDFSRVRGWYPRGGRFVERHQYLLFPVCHAATAHYISFFASDSSHLFRKSEMLEAYKREISVSHEMEAMNVVPRTSVPNRVKLIGSHVAYVRKPDGRIKARIVPWGRRDAEKSFLRKDAPCMNVEVFRIVLSIRVEKS